MTIFENLLNLANSVSPKEQFICKKCTDIPKLDDNLKQQLMAAIHDMTIPLCPNSFYHIFNQGINRHLIFFEKGNREYFLKKYIYYMNSYFETYAWVLMKNHFHLVIKVNDEESIMLQAILDFKRIDKGFLKKHSELIKNIGQKYPITVDLADPANLTNFGNLLNLAQRFSPDLLHHLLIWAVSERFRRFLLGYAKAINKQQKRTGSLFQKPYRRKLLSTTTDIQNAICNVHHNPIHHDYAIDYDQYAWSSYSECKMWERNTEDILFAIFDSREVFILCHEEYKRRKQTDLTGF